MRTARLQVRPFDREWLAGPDVQKLLGGQERVQRTRDAGGWNSKLEQRSGKRGWRGGRNSKLEQRSGKQGWSAAAAAKNFRLRLLFSSPSPFLRESIRTTPRLVSERDIYHAERSIPANSVLALTQGRFPAPRPNSCSISHPQSHLASDV